MPLKPRCPLSAPCDPLPPFPQTLDLNKDGVITLDEFTEACARDSTIVYNIDAMLHCDIAVLNSSDVSSDVTSSDPPPRAIRR